MLRLNAEKDGLGRGCVAVLQLLKHVHRPQQDDVRHPYVAIQEAGEVPLRQAKLGCRRLVADLGDDLPKKRLADRDGVQDVRLPTTELALCAVTNRANVAGSAGR